jgi:hypothetical protein
MPIISVHFAMPAIGEPSCQLLVYTLPCQLLVSLHANKMLSWKQKNKKNNQNNF